MKHTNHLLASLALGIATASCTTGAIEDGPDGIEHDNQPFSVTTEPAHQEITAEALSFLRPDIVVGLQAANVSTDVEFAFDAAHHFDNCDFSRSADTLRAHQTAAVAALGGLSIDGDLLAIKEFGNSLHTAQDFYSHTNWVELGAEGLVDATYAPFPELAPYQTLENGVVLVEGEPAGKTRVWRDREAAYPENAIVLVRLRNQRDPGLISGSVSYEPGNKCPAKVDMTHEELNKDNSTLPGKADEHAIAFDLAVEQTRHEWCRFVNLTNAQWGEAGLLRLRTWIADETTAPDCGVTWPTFPVPTFDATEGREAPATTDAETTVPHE